MPVHTVWHTSLKVPSEHTSGGFHLSHPALRKRAVDYAFSIEDQDDGKVPVGGFCAVKTPKSALRLLHSSQELDEFVVCVAAIRSAYRRKDADATGRVQLQYVECGDDVPGGTRGEFYLADTGLDVAVEDILGRVEVKFPAGVNLGSSVSDGPGEQCCTVPPFYLIRTCGSLACTVHCTCETVFCGRSAGAHYWAYITAHRRPLNSIHHPSAYRRR